MTDDLEPISVTLEDVAERLRARAAAWDALPDEERERRLQAELEEMHGEELRRLEVEIIRKLSCVPPRYRNATLDDDALLGWAGMFLAGESPRGLLLTGPTGVGKSHRAWALYQYVVRTGELSVQHRTVPALMSELRPDAYGSHHDTIFKLQHCSLLILDDLGAHKHSEWVEEQLYQIIDFRYSWQRPLVAVSNVPSSRLASLVGERIASRLAEYIDVLPLTGPDRRRV